MYHYWGYGLHIASEIEFPELLPFEFDTPEVTIRLGKTPEALTGENVVHKVRVSMSPDEYLLKFMNTANYYVANGTDIIVEPLPGAEQKTLRLFLLSNAMAAVLHQRDLIPFHASGVHYKDGVVLFCGESGAGKSTLATALSLEGYPLFTDDVCVLKSGEQNQMMAVASYPMAKLWVDSFEKIGIAKVNEEERIRIELPKYRHYFTNTFSSKQFSIKAVFVLNRKFDHNKLHIKSLSSIDAFKAIQMNTYRDLQMNAMKKRIRHFSIASELATSAAIYSVDRPFTENTVKELSQKIAHYLPLS